MEEKFLYHIWDAGHLSPPLKTASGKSLQIRYQGQFNTNRGPDFCNAMLEIDGVLCKGDVEIHINGSDWIGHNHQEDAHYNKVILHVVMQSQTQYTIKENGETAEILILKDQLSDDISKLLEEHRTDFTAETSTYCDLLSAIDTDTLTAILSQYGMSRFKSKVRRFNAALLFSDFDQVLYEGMMEALGYDKNKLNLLSVAQSIPLRHLRDWHREGMSAVDLVSIFCCSTGLIDRCGKILSPEFSAALRAAYERQGYFAKRLEIDWQLFRIRPSNHPVYRLIAISGLIHRTLEQGLLAHFQQNSALGDAKRDFRNFAAVFGGSALPGTEKLPQPGKNLISNIYVNIFLPIQYLYFDKQSGSGEAGKIAALYSAFPPLQDNHVTRFMQRYLSESHIDAANRKSIYQQGLMEIFNRWCRYHLCDECRAARREKTD